MSKADERKAGEERTQRIVRYLKPQEKVRSRALYEEMFPEDEEAFVDAYYRYKTPDNEILVMEEDGALISMLHLNPYSFRMRNRLVESSYIVAVATRPQYRHQGCMRALLTHALEDLYEKKHPFTFLMPADEAIYRPFDFRFMRNEDAREWVRAAMDTLAERFDLFVWKDARYETRHIPEEEWETTPMMVRIVHLEELLSQIGSTSGEPISLILDIRDPILQQNSGCYEWILKDGVSDLHKLSKAEQKGHKADISTGIGELGSFLFGAQTAREAFPGSADAVYEKLEQVAIYQNIYINEVV